MTINNFNCHISEILNLNILARCVYTVYVCMFGEALFVLYTQKRAALPIRLA